MLRTSLLGFVLAAALVGGGARADEPPPPPPPAPREGDPKPAVVEQAAPLSEEDAALIRELALLERVELLRHLELFEPTPERQQRARPVRRN